MHCDKNKDGTQNYGKSFMIMYNVLAFVILLLFDSQSDHKR